MPKFTLLNFFRVSLRELLLIVAFLAVGCAALKYASPTWITVVSACGLLCFMVAVVVALAERGRRQVLALGFASRMTIYGQSCFGLRRTSRTRN